MLRNRIAKNFTAGVIGKLSVVVFRLVQVPLLLSFLGVEDFGRWLVIYSLPSWLSLANLGFGSVASNEMAMSVAAGKIQNASAIFSTTFALLILIGVAGTFVLIGVTPLIAWEAIIDVPAFRHNELVMSIIFLAVSVFLSFSTELFGGRLRCGQKVHVSIFISSIRPWIELCTMIIMLKFSSRFDYLALSVLISTIIFWLFIQILSYRAFPQIYFHVFHIEKNRFLALLKKGAAFQAFPLGNALIFQGSLLVVQAVLGPVAVALYGTARTFVRTVSQGMELVNQTIWPEVSSLFGNRDFEKLRKLHRIAVLASASIAVTGVVVLGIFGTNLYSFWIKEAIPLTQSVLFLFLLSIPFNALWVTSSVIHMASNRHEGLAKRYLMSSIFCVAICCLLSVYLGIHGAALSTLMADLILTPYVLSHSLKLSRDTWPRFFYGMYSELKIVLSFVTNFRFKNL